MPNLKYKTRGMVSPQGKPRVYFCCHPKDFAGYFDGISDEILEKQNCSVWYLEDMTADYDELFFSDLKQMQLFVMPVTTNLLCTQNRALEVEFPFAIENHIPVLPLMQESGLEELFNQKCGDLQFLDKNNRDITAIRYEEKLEKYLSAILIGDELAEKIRAAFDAYVFLSYRKKDRQYAQELMRLIHKNEFCRDIAIWYDEFLTPGENFNDSIREALQKSGLFVLTVTPNLVNEDNYIRTTEYPMAKQAGKPILPAELLPTDQTLLAEKYEDIPHCTDAHNDADLTAALLEAVKGMAIRENDASLEHNFFIGLAYLGGVDVEVDQNKAINMIKNSANSGFTTAMKFLAECFRLGKGVCIDYQKFVNWEEKLIYIYQEKFHDGFCEKDGYKLVDELIYFAQCLFDLQYIEESISISTTALAELKKIKGNNNDKYMMCLCCCYETIADSQSKKDSRIAEQYYYLEHMVLKKQLGADNVTHENILIFVRQLSGCLLKRYNILIESNVDIANDVMLELLEIYNEYFPTQTSTINEKRTFSLILERRGIHLFEGKHYEEARKIFTDKYSLDLDLYEETKELNDLRNLSIALEKLGDIALISEDSSKKEALTFYKQALEKEQYIVNNSTSIDSLRDLSIGYEKIADLYATQNQLQEAKDNYLESFGIRIKIHDITNSVQSLEDCGLSCYKLGRITMSKKILQQAYDIFSVLSISTSRKLWHNDIMEHIKCLLPNSTDF